MSGVPGNKRGKGRRRNRGNRGRGSQQLSQSGTTPLRESPQDGGDEESREENNQASAQDVFELQQQYGQDSPSMVAYELHGPSNLSATETESQADLKSKQKPQKLKHAGKTSPALRATSQPKQEQALQKHEASMSSTQSKAVATATMSEERPASTTSYGGSREKPGQLSSDVLAANRPMMSEKPIPDDKAKTPLSPSSEVSKLGNMLEKQLDIRSEPHGLTQPSNVCTKTKYAEQQAGSRSKPSKPPQLLPTSSRQTPQSDKAEPRPIRRPDRGGTLGRRIRLRVNFLPVSLPEIDIHHYRTDIAAKGFEAGKGYTKREAPLIIKCMVEQYEQANPHGPKLVYDKKGENVYCKIPIPGIENSREYPVLFTTDNGKQREYIVKIKWVSKVSLYDLNEALKGNRTEIPKDTMQAIEVVLQHLPNMTSISVGASFFNPTDARKKDLGYDVQVWNGTFLSIRPTQWKMMMLNVDTCSTVFYKAQPVLSFLCKFLKFEVPPTRLNRGQIENFNDEIKGLKIETTHIKRKQKVSSVSTVPARNEMFDCDGTQISVFEYFKKKYNIALQYPDLPCLKLGQNAACIPLELCNIMDGQRKQGKLTKEQLQAMIKHTALPAPERQQLINDLVRNAEFDKDEFLADFGFKVRHDMACINGRVLKPPVIEYAQEEKELPRNGQWNMQHKSYKPIDLMEWAIVSYENPRFLNDKNLDIFVHSLVQAGRDKGLSIHPSPCHRSMMRGSETIKELFSDLHHRHPNLQLLVIVLPGKGDLDVYYEAIKYYGDVVYGIRTQVIKANTASRKANDKQTMANICLKINAKLGGTTSILEKSVKSEIFNRPVIIFGADVTHPSPRDENSPSIAAVVASMDSHPNLYSAEVRVQERRKEIILELKDIVKTLLKKFRSATRAQPEKIIFYRDGVGEGQFKDVLLHELRAIQVACYELHASYKPAITFIVVQKRHHTRFFAEDPKDQCGRSKNIPPGTVVDTDICHPYEFDWYLCSHAGIQGTNKPAHYYVLYDDSDFTSDQLQTLSNQLCHTYVRCARAVSIPAPAYYAHHVAFRARYHLGKLERDKRNKPLSSQEMTSAVNIHERMTNTMYFA